VTSSDFRDLGGMECLLAWDQVVTWEGCIQEACTWDLAKGVCTPVWAIQAWEDPWEECHQAWEDPCNMRLLHQRRNVRPKKPMEAK